MPHGKKGSKQLEPNAIRIEDICECCKNIGRSSPTREADAGRSARALDALLRWRILRCEI
jgi:hypothetical protein